MAVNYKIENRRVIPNWRDFKRTVKLNELMVTGKKSEIKISLVNVINAWKANKSIGTAADLINASFLSESYECNEIKEATQFITENSDKSSKVLLDLANNVNSYSIGIDSDTVNLIQLEVESIADFQQHFENQTIYKVLSLTKNRSKNELQNPIIWVELSRLYAFLGQESKAEKAMLIALQLAPENRYVLRSATRLFIHFESHERALFYLRKSEALKFDPWLISAHIATSSIMNRYSPFIKNGIQIVNSMNFSDYEITELASSLGTLEYSEGSVKKAKKLLGQSLKAPNDNSLAQMEWLSHQDKSFIFDALSFRTHVPNPFEAFAFDAFESGNWKDVIHNSIYWFLDIPYSRRPIMLGSYVACMLLKDYETAFNLCKVGLQAKPNDANMLNNIVYSLLMMNKLEEAEPYLNSMSNIGFDELAVEDIIPIQATFGLAAFRNGDLVSGQEFYEQAIRSAQESKNYHLEKMASLIYLRELILNNCKNKISDHIRILQNIKPTEGPEIQQLKNDVKELYERYERRGLN